MRSGGAVGAESCGGSSAAVTAELTAPPSQEGAVPRAVPCCASPRLSSLHQPCFVQLLTSPEMCMAF